MFLSIIVKVADIVAKPLNSLLVHGAGRKFVLALTALALSILQKDALNVLLTLIILESIPVVANKLENVKSGVLGVINKNKSAHSMKQEDQDEKTGPEA